MKISERIWMIVFTVLELAVPFLCYSYPKIFSYEVMILLLPIGMALTYLLFFGAERLFESDVMAYGKFHIYMIFASCIFLMAFDDVYFLLGIGSIVTAVIDDVIFAIIFIVIGKVYGLESTLVKGLKEKGAFSEKDSRAYEDFWTDEEKMYWEELERRQRERFRRQNWTRGNVNWEKNSEFRQSHKEMQREAKPKFLFEKTLYFRSISSLEEVRPRYLSLMKKYHPDMPEGSKEIAQEIQSEYDKICKENGL
ncbi:MAG: hypothetical protein HDR01_08715 [Lachnospiraceae bacterium]|nr:hypothetical protein [Lachnospiraceae bacterium]